MQKIDNYNFIKIFTVNLDQLHVFFYTFEQGGGGGVRWLGVCGHRPAQPQDPPLLHANVFVSVINEKKNKVSHFHVLSMYE